MITSEFLMISFETKAGDQPYCLVTYTRFFTGE